MPPLLVPAWSVPVPLQSRRQPARALCVRMAASDGGATRQRRKRPKAPAKGPSRLDRNVDDLIGKRLGRGNMCVCAPSTP